MNSSDILIIVVLTLIGVLLLWLEFRSRLGVRRILRLTATLLALISVYFLWHTVLPAAPNGRTAVIASEGFDEQALDRAVRKYGKENVFMESSDAYDMPEPGRYDSVLISGYGPRAAGLLQPGHQHINYVPPEVPDGILGVSTPNKVIANQPFLISGSVKGQGIRLVIKISGFAPDTVPVVNGQFNATVRLKTPGQHLLHLEALDSLDHTLGHDPVDVVAESAFPLKFIFLSSFPSPEFRFLRENLSADGHSIISRTTVSRGSFSWGYINAERTTYIWSELGNTDLLIADAATVKAFTSTQKKSLEAAIENGLGLLIPVDGEIRTGLFDDVQQPEVIDGTPETSLFKGIEIETLPVRFKNGLMDGLLGVSRLGKGKIAASALGTTYPLLLSGDSVIYRELWADIIRYGGRQRIQPSFGFPPVYDRFKDQEMDISVFSTEIPDVFIENIPVAIRQSAYEPEHWQMQYWPARPGWHEAVAVIGSDTIRDYFFVPDSSDWRSSRWNERKMRIAHILSESPEVTKKAQPQDFYFLWLCLLFISLGYLWLEPRI